VHYDLGLFQGGGLFVLDVSPHYIRIVPPTRLILLEGRRLRGRSGSRNFWEGFSKFGGGWVRIASPPPAGV
jgi:hypothetical protein